MSTLKVNNIAGVSGGTSPPITLSGDTVTLGTGTTIGTAVTINAGTNVSGIGQLVGVSYAGNNSTNTDGNDVTVDPNKDYIVWLYAWNSSSYSHMEVWKATGNGTNHALASLSPDMSSQMNIEAGSGGNGFLRYTVGSAFSYGQALFFEQGTGIDIT